MTREHFEYVKKKLTDRIRTACRRSAKAHNSTKTVDLIIERTISNMILSLLATCSAIELGYEAKIKKLKEER